MISIRVSAVLGLSLSSFLHDSGFSSHRICSWYIKSDLLIVVNLSLKIIDLGGVVTHLLLIAVVLKWIKPFRH
jgi:hypothetical protein